MHTVELVQSTNLSDRQLDDRDVPMHEHSTVGLVELMLKNPGRLDELIRDDSRQHELVTQFLRIGLVGFTIFGIAATVVLNAAGEWPTGVPWAHWRGPTVANLTIAYNFGLIAATGVCLPSFYFFGLLSGIKTSMLQVTVHALKGAAVTAVTLVGILPIHLAVVLGAVVFEIGPGPTRLAIYIALALPFIAGLWGVRSLYLGFVGLCDTMPLNRRYARECFLRRLILSWSTCYTAVTPLMIYTLWSHLSC